MIETDINNIIINSDKYLSEYMEFLHACRKSENTINSYITTINYFIFHLKENGNTDYLSNNSFNKTTIKQKQCVLSNFQNFLNGKGYITKPLFERLKVKKPVREVKLPDINDINKFLKSKEREIFKLIYKIIAQTGARISEVISLEKAWFKKDRKIINIKGKGDKERFLFLNNDLINDILSFINKNKNKSKFIFLDRNKNTLSRTTVGKVFSKYKFTPHMVRALYATTMHFEHNIPATKLQIMLGHSSITTTMQYIRMDINKISDEVSSIFET